MQFDESAFKNLKDTVGRFPAETGGILLGSITDFNVQEFIFDHNGKTSSSAYDPDIDFLNKELKQARKRGLEFLGFIHSHPYGVSRLSADQGNGIGDLGYIKVIFDAFPELDRLLVPIVFSSHDGEFDIFPYVAFRSDIENYVMAELEIIKPNNLCLDNY